MKGGMALQATLPEFTERERAINDDLVIAGRILTSQGILDSLGHVSSRRPGQPGEYLMSWARSPVLVRHDDIMVHQVDGSEPRSSERPSYYERFIHAAIYEKRPDVMAICHSHCPAVLPFCVSNAPLVPVLHTAALIGERAEVWDMAEDFGDGTNLLVSDMERGRSLARGLGDSAVILMRGHGMTIVGSSVRDVVISAIHVKINAQALLAASGLGDALRPLHRNEIDGWNEFQAAVASERGATTRLWDYYAHIAEGILGTTG